MDSGIYTHFDFTADDEDSAVAELAGAARVFHFTGTSPGREQASVPRHAGTLEWNGAAAFFLEEQFGAVDWSSPVVWEDAKEKQRRFAAVAQQLQEAGKEEAQAYQALADCLAEKLAAEQQKGAETR